MTQLQTLVISAFCSISNAFQDGEVMRKFSDHPDTVTTVCVQDEHLFAACRNKVIFMWDIVVRFIGCMESIFCS